MAGMTFAQGRGARRGGPDGPGGRGGIGAPGIALRGLDLTDVQQDQIREIVQRYQQQMRADIMLVLTPDQQQKLKDAEAKREARTKERLNRLQQRQQQPQAQPQPQ
jgi:Spy/CpxP family protein refolding chaperone